MIQPVSYTHLDVYKRQPVMFVLSVQSRNINLTQEWIKIISITSENLM